MLARSWGSQFCLSVCPSVTRMFCDKAKEHTAEILTSHERVTKLVFWYQKRLLGDVPFHLKFALSDPPPFKKRRLWPISAYNVSTIRASDKFSITANRKLTTRFPTSYRRSAYVTPNSPKGWLKKQICRFLWIKFKFNRIKSATKFLSVKTSSGKVVVEPFPYPNVYRCWQ